MELHSVKNKSVYNVPPEMEPDKADFVQYGDEFWVRTENAEALGLDLEIALEENGGEWTNILQSAVPAGSTVFRISSPDVAESTSTDDEDEEEEVSELVETGERQVPGIIGASSQEHIDPMTGVVKDAE